MEKDKTIEVLNSLITINNDRKAGYNKALKEKTLFEKFISTSNWHWKSTYLVTRQPKVQ